MARKSWFTVQPVAQAAEGGKKISVDIFGEIGWDVDAGAFSRAIAAAGAVDEIHLSIHSPGGSVLDGWAVANILLNHPAKISARVEGVAASMASVILLAADVREIPENAYVMIHSVSAGIVGGSDEMRRAADLMDKLQDDIVSFYVARTGQTDEQLRAWMAEDTWMNGKEALERGFATMLLPAVQIAALTDGLDAMDRRFANLPSALAETPEPAAEPAAAEPTPEPAPAAEPTPEPATEPTPAAEPEPVAHVERISKLQALKTLLTGKPAPAVASPENDLKSLRAQLLAERGEREEIANRAQALERENKQLKSEARDLDAVLEELGLSAAEARDLPGNQCEDDLLTVKEQFAKIKDPVARRKFYTENKAALEK